MPSEFLSNVSVDCVLFGFDDNQIKVLLLKSKFDDVWSLAGGFIKHDESVEEAATRVLRERTGFDNIFLTQFHVFSSISRKNPLATKENLGKLGYDLNEYDWYNQRFISVGFYALIRDTNIVSLPDSFSSNCEWVNIDKVGNLMMDHNEILKKALETIRIQIRYQPIGLNLLPDKFTMSELQKLYETILGKELDRRNFQRKILSSEILDRLPEKRIGVAHKAPYYYRFNLENYNKAQQEGIQGAW